MNWKLTDTAPENVVIMTKIDDSNGCRNEQAMKRQGDLWWTPDGGMYVYYYPTHWREMTAEEVDNEKRRMQSEVERVKASHEVQYLTADGVRS